jgi:hypothetical protein
MKKYLFLFLAFCSFLCFSQESNFEKPNYNSIKKNIEDKDSNFYYTNLMNRFVANDTLLTNDEYRHLYLGYVFNSKYNPFYNPKDQDNLLNYYKSEKLSETDYEDIIKISEKALLDFPFDLRVMNFLGYVYHLKGDEVSAKKTSDKFHKLVETILSTGDGKTCETGFHVIMVSHEYTILNLFQLQYKSQALIGNCDYMSFEKGKYSVDGIYFNIEKMLENEHKMLGEK